jgi:hypothetical protein
MSKSVRRARQRFGQAALQSPFSNVEQDFPFAQSAQSLIWLEVYPFSTFSSQSLSDVPASRLQFWSVLQIVA